MILPRLCVTFWCSGDLTWCIQSDPISIFTTPSVQYKARPTATRKLGSNLHLLSHAPCDKEKLRQWWYSWARRHTGTLQESSNSPVRLNVCINVNVHSTKNVNPRFQQNVLFTRTESLYNVQISLSTIIHETPDMHSHYHIYQANVNVNLWPVI